MAKLYKAKVTIINDTGAIRSDEQAAAIDLLNNYPTGTWDLILNNKEMIAENLNTSDAQTLVNSIWNSVPKQLLPDSKKALELKLIK